MANCNSCGRLVVLGKTADGKNIPLDPKAFVYRIVDQTETGALIDRAPAVMVSHAATCPGMNKRAAVSDDREIYP